MSSITITASTDTRPVHSSPSQKAPSRQGARRRRHERQFFPIFCRSERRTCPCSYSRWRPQARPSSEAWNMPSLVHPIDGAHDCFPFACRYCAMAALTVCLLFEITDDETLDRVVQTLLARAGSDGPPGLLPVQHHDGGAFCDVGSVSWPCESNHLVCGCNDE